MFKNNPFSTVRRRCPSNNNQGSPKHWCFEITFEWYLKYLVETYCMRRCVRGLKYPNLFPAAQGYYSPNQFHRKIMINPFTRVRLQGRELTPFSSSFRYTFRCIAFVAQVSNLEALISGETAVACICLVEIGAEFLGG